LENIEKWNPDSK